MTDPYRFFRSLEQHLNEALPGPREVATSIADIVRTSKASRTDLHKSFPEGALLNHYLLPAIHSFLSRREGMDLDRARQSLLSDRTGRCGRMRRGLLHDCLGTHLRR